MGVRLVVAGVVVGLLVGGCTSARLEPVPPPPAPAPKPLVEPLKFVPEPAWRASPVAGNVAVLRDATLVWSDTDLTMLDTKTGATRWQLRAGEDMGGGVAWRRSADRRVRLTDHGVVVGFRGIRELGVMLLSTVDGRALWRQPLFKSEVDRIVAAGDEAVLVDAAGRAVLIDTRTGKTVWERDGARPGGIAGYSVVVTEGPVQQDEGTVRGLDLITGKPEWELSGYDRGRVVLTVGSYALVSVVKAGRREQVVVDSETGAVVTPFGDAERGGCLTDERAALACPAASGWDTFQASDRTVRRGVTMPAPIDSAWADRLFTRPPGTVDLAGTRVERDLPGELGGFGEGYVLFVDREAAEIRAYPVRP